MSYPIVNLGTLGEVYAGGTPSRRESAYWGTGYKWLSIRDYKDFDLVTNTTEQITADGLQNSSAKLFEKGSVIISIFATLGRVAILGEKMATNQAIAAIRCNEKVDSTYLMYCLKSKLSEILKQSGGVAQKNINLSILKGLNIPLPPLETQKQIAAVLEKADQLRKDCQQMEQELNSLAQSVFIDMFGDPIANPKRWELHLLNEFYASEKTGTKCGPFGSALKKDEFVESGIPVWNMDNISLQGKFRDGASLWITKDKFEDLESYSVNQGDVIISRAGTVGKMGVVDSVYEQSIISTNLIRVRFGDKLHPLYFVCLMTYFKSRLKRLKVGDDGSFSHMNTGILDKLEFPYPPREEQDKYVEFRKKLDFQLNQLTQLKSEYEENFNALMQKAFKGELNLNKTAA